MLATKFSVFFLILSIISVTSHRSYNEESCDSSDNDSESSSSSEERHKHHKHHHHHHEPRPEPETTTQRVPKCDDGWITSHRPQGDWCLKVSIVNLEYAGAAATCIPFNATLSGVQNAEERMIIANDAVQKVTALGLDRGGVWLGMQRITGTKLFQWTDGNTVGYEGYLWGPTQPDDSPVWGHQNCAQIVALAPGFPHGQGDFYSNGNYQNGWMDDIYCTGEWLPPTRLAVCGKLPS